MEITGKYIIDFRKKYSLSQEELAEMLSVHRRTIQNWEGGGTIPKTKMGALEKKINEMSNNVLFNGHEIVPSDSETIITKAGMQFIPNKGGSYTMLTPHITEYGYAGYMRGFSNETYVAEMPIFPVVVHELHRGAYISITNRGESMDDGTRESIMDGDILTGRFVQRHLWENNLIHYKKHRFFIIHHIDGILIKQITEHDVEGKRIKIHSLNPDKEAYPDEWIDLTKVKELFNVTQKSQKM